MSTPLPPLGQPPLVSVVMPAYNHEAFVGRSIASVLEQDYSHVELIVIDDGSRDGTWQEILRARETAKRPFVAHTQVNQGVCRTLNRGVSLARGDLIAVLASDDYYLPAKISLQVDAFQSSSRSVALVHTSAFLDYQNGRPLEDLTGSYRPAVGACFDDVLTQAVRIVAPSIMFRRSAFDAIGGFDESIEAEDVDFFLRLAHAGYEFGYVPRPLMVKTVVEGSGGSQLRKLIMVHERILEKHARHLGPTRSSSLRTLMYRHLIMLSAGAGDYALAFETAIELAQSTRSPVPLLDFARWTSRAMTLRALPASVRHQLRLMRAELRKHRDAR